MNRDVVQKCYAAEAALAALLAGNGAHAYREEERDLDNALSTVKQIRSRASD